MGLMAKLGLARGGRRTARHTLARRAAASSALREALTGDAVSLSTFSKLVDLFSELAIELDPLMARLRSPEDALASLM